MHPALRITTLPLFMVIGLVLLVSSIPMILLGVLCLMGGSEDYADWIMDHMPISFWYNFVERLNNG